MGQKHQRPMYLGEFGVYNRADTTSRARWASFVRHQAEKRAWSWAWWYFDDEFGVFDRKKDAWIESVRRALMPTAIALPGAAISFADMPETHPRQITPMRAALRIGKVASSASQVPQYGQLELVVDLGATYENPFDPDEVRLDADFTSPSGKAHRVPGFFMVDCRAR